MCHSKDITMGARHACLTAEEKKILKQSWVKYGKNKQAQTRVVFNFFGDREIVNRLPDYSRIQAYMLANHLKIKAIAYNLIAFISNIVDNINDQPLVDAFIHNHARNHIPRQITRANFKQFEECLFDVIGKQMDEKTKEVWRKALHLFVDQQLRDTALLTGKLAPGECQPSRISKRSQSRENYTFAKE